VTAFWAEPPAGAPAGWPWSVLWPRPVVPHLVYCLGCGGIWLDDGDDPGGECACTCGDPSLPGYEDWLVIPDPSG
jgi:hypothetical protein